MDDPQFPVHALHHRIYLPLTELAYHYKLGGPCKDDRYQKNMSPTKKLRASSTDSPVIQKNAVNEPKGGSFKTYLIRTNYILG